MTSIEVDIERSGRLAAAAARAWDIVADVSRYGELVPQVVDYHRDGDGWRWVLEGNSPAGVIRPTFTAVYEIAEGEAVRFDSAERNVDGDPIAQGMFRVAADGAGTNLEVWLRIEAELPVPSLLAGPAKRFVIGELRTIADGFIANVRDEIRRP